MSKGHKMQSEFRSAPFAPQVSAIDPSLALHFLIPNSPCLPLFCSWQLPSPTQQLT